MVKLNAAFIADSANISREGKLNILGIFNSITATAFPVAHPWMVLVFVLEGERSDVQREHELKVDLIDEDGRQMIPTLGVTLKLAPAGPWATVTAPQIFQLANVRFPAAGRYEFKIVVDGAVLGGVPLMVTQLKPEVAPGGTV